MLFRHNGTQRSAGKCTIKSNSFRRHWSNSARCPRTPAPQHDLAGDIKKLKGFKNKYRLRAGNYRALFELEGPCLVVYDVGDRKDIYE